MLPGYFPSSGPAPVGGPVRVKERIEEAQRWLLFMRHCSTCNAGEAQTCEHGERCKSGRALYRHMSTCQAGSGCSYPKCALVKAILKHHQKCTRIQCQICMPVKAYVHSKPASTNNTPSPTSGASASTHAGSHAVASSSYAGAGMGAGPHAQLQQMLKAANHSMPPSGTAYPLPLAPTSTQFPNSGLVPDPVLDPLAHPQLSGYPGLPGQTYPLQPGMAPPLPLPPTGALPPGTDPVSAQAYFLQLYMQSRGYKDDPHALPPARTGRHSMDAGLINRPMPHAAQGPLARHPAQAPQSQHGQPSQPLQPWQYLQQAYAAQHQQRAQAAQHPSPSPQGPEQPQHQVASAQGQGSPSLTSTPPPSVPASTRATTSPTSAGQATSAEQQLVGTKRPPPSPPDSSAEAGRMSGVRGVGIASLLGPTMNDMTLRDPRLFAGSATRGSLAHSLSSPALCSAALPSAVGMPTPAVTSVVEPTSTATTVLLEPSVSLHMPAASRPVPLPHVPNGEDPTSRPMIEEDMQAGAAASTGAMAISPSGTHTAAAKLHAATTEVGGQETDDDLEQRMSSWRMRAPCSPSPAGGSIQTQQPSSSSGNSQQPSSTTGPILSVASAMAAAAASRAGCALPVVASPHAAACKRSNTPPEQAEQAAALLLSLKQEPPSPSL